MPCAPAAVQPWSPAWSRGWEVDTDFGNPVGGGSGAGLV